VPEPFKVTLAIYNEAGERVRVIFEGTASQAGPRLVVKSEVQPDGSTLVTLSGFTNANGSSVTWDSRNDNGQGVANGVYYAKMETQDPFGATQSYSEAFSVLSTADQASVEVFNSAGERVRSMPLAGALPVDMRALAESFLGGVDASGQPVGGLRLALKQAGGETPLLWDGLNDQGEPLGSGSYTVVLSRTQAGGSRVVKTLNVVLLAGVDEGLQKSLASAVVAPNPVRGEAVPVRVRYDLPPRGSAVCRLYDLAGQLVAQGADVAGTGSVDLQAGFAGGVYLIEFRIQDGAAILGRRTLKAAVVR
jgi:flagellar hook assembly protein FlgD